MPRSLHLFNLLLALAAAILATALVHAFLDGAAPTDRRPVASALATAAPTADISASPSGLDSPVAALAEFDVILQRNPFRNPAVDTPAPPAAPPVAPRPVAALPTLLGTMIVGDQRRALLKDGSRIELFAPGDTVGGGTVVEIDTDRVVIRTGDTLGEVWLKTSIREAAAAGLASSPSASMPADRAASRPVRHGRRRVPEHVQVPSGPAEGP